MITRTRILLLILFAVVAAAAFLGPNRVGLIIVLALAAFLSTILLGVFFGVRDSFRRPRSDGEAD